MAAGNIATTNSKLLKTEQVGYLTVINIMLGQVAVSDTNNFCSGITLG